VKFGKVGIEEGRFDIGSDVW